MGGGGRGGKSLFPLPLSRGVLEGVAFILLIYNAVVHDSPPDAEGEGVGTVSVPALPNKEVTVTHGPILGKGV